MPNLILGNLAKETAKTRFRGFNITLPAMASSSAGTQRVPNQPMARQANVRPAAQTVNIAGGGASSRLANFGVTPSAPASGSAASAPATATPMAFPPALFRAASNSKDDVDNQKGMHDMFNGIFDGIIDAIEFGFNAYRQSAGLVDVQVMAVTAIGGRLKGPPLDGLIKSAPSVAGWGGWEAMVRDAVAGGFEHQWSALAASVQVPGLPWYPAFAAFPGPMAPPMPNIPTPFIALTHDLTATSPYNLRTAMRSALSGSMDYSTEFFESIAVAFQIPLQLWKASQQVTLVMGKGPIPTFAPPYVPVGPVVAGSILPGQHIRT